MNKRNHQHIHKPISDILFDAIVYFISFMVIVLIVYPLYFVVIASFSDPNAVATGQVWLYPKGFTLDGYEELLRQSRIWVGYRNTILYTFLGTLIALLVNIPAAYALSRKDLIGRKGLMAYFVFTMFFSGGTIPIFLVVSKLNLIDTVTVMVLPFAVSAYNIIVARTFFVSSIPNELLDSAKIDGCGNTRFFVQIVLPLSKAILAVIGLWTAVGHWNSYFNALIYLRNPSLLPLQIVLRDILITSNMQGSMGTGEAAQIALRLANLLRYSSIIVSTVPILLAYPFIQKHFNQGVMIGSVKG